MNDFGTYVCFAICWFDSSSGFFMGNALRWAGGIFLILFNIWVKLDAQRVVKDFAWCKSILYVNLLFYLYLLKEHHCCVKIL
jgi:hypothetical protein